MQSARFTQRVKDMYGFLQLPLNVTWLQIQKTWLCINNYKYKWIQFEQTEQFEGDAESVLLYRTLFHNRTMIKVNNKINLSVEKWCLIVGFRGVGC